MCVCVCVCVCLCVCVCVFWILLMIRLGESLVDSSDNEDIYISLYLMYWALLRLAKEFCQWFFFWLGICYNWLCSISTYDFSLFLFYGIFSQISICMIFLICNLYHLVFSHPQNYRIIMKINKIVIALVKSIEYFLNSIWNGAKTHSYSFKNTPLLNKRQHKLELLNKIESFISNMKWKAYFFFITSKFQTGYTDIEEHYGFKTNKHLPHLKDLYILSQI